MSGFLNANTRLGIGVFLILGAIGFFIYGWMERSAGNPFNQIWTLAIISLLGAMFQFQKIGGGQNKNRQKDE